MAPSLSRNGRPRGGGGRGTTAALGLCALTHAYLLFSVFPYAAYFALFLLGGDGDATRTSSSRSSTIATHHVLTADNIGIYAGLIGSAFTLGRTLGFVPWRSVRVRLGDRCALLSSLLLSAICSVAFGTSRSFASAVAFRFLLGLSNGISGAVKRAAIDRARAKRRRSSDGDGGDADSGEEEEWAAASKILAVMGWGCALGPAVGGWLSDPRGQYSHPVGKPMSGSRWLFEYPFLLPNVFGAALCVLSALAVLLVVEDTRTNHGASSHKQNAAGTEHTGTEVGGLQAEGEGSPLLSDKSGRSSSSGSDRREDKSKKSSSAFSVIWKTKSTRSHLIAYYAFSFSVACIDDALPLFLMARLGGPGLSESQIGWILGAAGAIAVLCQHMAFDKLLMERMGVYQALRLSGVLGNTPSFFLPTALILNGGTYAALALAGFQPGLGVTGLSFAFLVILIGLLRIFATMYFSLIGIATGRTVPLSYKDETSRIMTIGALAARAVAPAVAGCIATLSAGHPWALWTSIGLVIGAVAAALTYVLHDASSAGKEKVHSEVLERRRTYLSMRERRRTSAHLWNLHYDHSSSDVAAKWRKLARKAIAVNRVTGGSLAAHAASETSSKTHKKKKSNRISWVDRSLRPGIDVDEIPFFIIGTQKGDEQCQPHVMTPPLLDALHKQLPAAVCDCNYWLKYSLIRDGSSLTALESMTSLSKYTVMAIETLDGNVFGGFVANPWEMTRGYKKGGGQSFLWRMRQPRALSSTLSSEEISAIEEDIEVYKWTGENDFCQLMARDRIAMGGGVISGEDGDGFGFTISEDLMAGSSGPCVTYNNPCLVSDSEGGQFEVANIEVWALTPFLFVADAERSERAHRYTEENLVVRADGQTPSNQSPWSQFM